MRKTLVITILFSTILLCQDLQVIKIEPGNWWSGMKKNKIQLMVYGKNLSEYTASFNTKNISVDSIHQLANQDYSFIDLTIQPEATFGNYKLLFTRKKKTVSIDFPLLKREDSQQIHQGFSREDVVYLLMPDRFSDGDTSNNVISGMKNEYNRKSHLSRHGGDLQGVINHLKYFTDLGITSLWLTPVLENNKNISYHGYAATDLYKVDSRFGGNEKYKELVAQAHSEGLKIIYDHVSNHIGTNHPWVDNPPMPDWINGTKENHLNAWHDKMVTMDIHSVKITQDHLTKGWFVDDMADLNQQNNYVKNYLIQNSIWWIEYSGLDGIREDTYPYADGKFLACWAKEIMNEFPRFNIVGEVWTGVTPFLAAFQKGSKLNKKYDTNLPVVTDFAIQNAYCDFLKGKSDFYKIYETISMDYLYEDPNDILTFADNHDIARIMFNADGNVKKAKLVLMHLLTSRGIPQLLYATEIGMVGAEEHGILRSDFPGGFPGDERNAFESSGRSEKENGIFNFTKNLLALRKRYKSLSSGELFHLPPNDNVYMYLKKYGEEKILVVLNGNSKEKEINKYLLDALCGISSKLVKLEGENQIEMIDKAITIPAMAGEMFLIK